MSVPCQCQSVPWSHPGGLSPTHPLWVTNAGTQALSEAGLIPALLPLLRDTHPDHLPLVASTVRILEAFMDFK